MMAELTNYPKLGFVPRGTGGGASSLLLLMACLSIELGFFGGGGGGGAFRWFRSGVAVTAVGVGFGRWAGCAAGC